jgi:hypothetical protein
MKTHERALFLLLLTLALPLRVSYAAGPEGCPFEGSVSEYDASDPDAPMVTEENLFDSERFWPYRAQLTSSWRPPGREEPLPSGVHGVLVRFERPTVARVDFGRFGVYEVPVGKTDLVKRSNRVRSGELKKVGPNFFHAIGPRLVDSASEEPRAFDLRGVAGCRGFLAVFADPEGGQLGELAMALGPLREHDGVLTVFFPQGRHPDLKVREALRSLLWTVPFVLDQLSEGYTESLLAEGAALPAVMLQTPEGRVLAQGTWKPELASELSAAVEKAFGDRAAVTAETDARPNP